MGMEKTLDAIIEEAIKNLVAQVRKQAFKEAASRITTFRARGYTWTDDAICDAALEIGAME